MVIKQKQKRIIMGPSARIHETELRFCMGRFKQKSEILFFFRGGSYIALLTE